LAAVSLSFVRFQQLGQTLNQLGMTAAKVVLLPREEVAQVKDSWLEKSLKPEAADSSIWLTGQMRTQSTHHYILLL
jgi:hypothetical protein